MLTWQKSRAFSEVEGIELVNLRYTAKFGGCSLNNMDDRAIESLP